jgi:hypothetical protein
MDIWRHRFGRFSRALGRAVLLGSLGLAGLAAQAEDDPPGRVGRLAEMKGQVWLLEAGQGEWQTAERNRPLTTADRLATDADSRAEVQIGSTIVRIDQGSDLEVTRLDDERIELMLHSGAAALRVREAEVAPEVMLMTPEGRFQPRSAGLFRIDRSERGSLAGATQGELDFESSDAQLTLRAGQRAELWFDQGDNRTHYNWAGLPNDEFENWVRKDDARDERYATRRPISPEMTGADDLEGHGQWDTHPEYGTVWAPTTVAVGWAPYRYGRWAWVRPWGWTWVDDAPWGFAPFHYGRWVHWRSRWVWAPGTYVRRPVYAPAMVAWVGGSNFSVGVSFGRPVGWVPLAPREVYRPMYKVSPVYIKQVNVTHVHIHDHDNDRRRREPIAYRNSSVAGGVTVVSSDVLTRRQPIATAKRAPDTSVIAAMRNRRAEVGVEPPKPDNASLAPRAVRRPDAAVAPPPRSVAQVAERDGRIPRAERVRAGVQPQAGSPGRAEPGAGRPQAGNPRDAQATPREPGRADQVRDRVERPAVARPPITQRNEPRDGAAPAPQPREQRDNTRRESLQQAPAEPVREQRERREPRESQARPFAPQPQAAPREERQERPERAERPERPQRQVERQERPERIAQTQTERPARQEQKAERQQQREERQERQREPNQKRERERESRGMN